MSVRSPKGGQVFERTMAALDLEPRPQQTQLVKLSRAVLHQAIDAPRGEQPTQFVQAGTGTGKSYAILTLAVEAAERLYPSDFPDEEPYRLPSVVICPTNRLIDQYIGKDAPKIAEVTGADIQYLKGRSRYLCAESYGFDSQFGSMAKEEFARRVKDGRLEWAQHYGFDESHGCDGDCANDEATCGVQIARQRARSADVVVTNGHLLTWDQLVQDFTDGQARLLPEYGALFVDEAHELDPVVRSCLSDQIGPNAEIYKVIPGLKRWVMSQVTEAALSDKNRECLPPSESQDADLAQMVSIARKERAGLLREEDSTKAMGDNAHLKNIKKALKAISRFMEFAEDSDERFISTISVEPDQTYPGGLKPYLNRVCIDAAPTAGPILTRQPSILVSGTLPDTLPRRLGVRNQLFDDVGTPFDYSRSTLLVSSFDARNYDHEVKRLSELKGAVLDMALRPRSEGGGGTLILTTSWDDLAMIGAYLAKNIPTDIPILAQSKDPADTQEMLEEFQDSPVNSVLIGVRSFWTGIDVPGPALRQLYVWRLPYSVPTAEVKAIGELYGRKVYKESMLELLAQGIGRLVRTKDDDGRVIIADNRARGISWSASSLTTHIDNFRQPQRR